ncbi:hypothetical protein V2J09_003818 [Rumex salicifolius]
MRTRSGVYPGEVFHFCLDEPRSDNRKRRRGGDSTERQFSAYRKRTKRSSRITAIDSYGGGEIDFFDVLPDDLIVSILEKISSSASCPADFATVLLTCKRFNGLGLQPMVLAKASPKVFAVKAKNWSEFAHRFFKRSAIAANLEACYTLGMIRFYCLHNRASGASLMAKAAIGGHAQAMFSLAVIQFNGSGGAKSDRDLRAGVALCGRAAFFGHIDALRELGHCLQDGYGVRQSIVEGRRFLVQANAKEFAAVMSADPSKAWITCNTDHRHQSAEIISPAGCPLLSDFGCDIPPLDAHPANRFLVDWFAERGGVEELILCSHNACGRPETRPNEFRRCSVCGKANYCSRACQALDWKLRHKDKCAAALRWPNEDALGDN